MNKKQEAIVVEDAQTVSIIRRSAALFYDLMLILALLVVAAALAVLPAGMIFDYKIPADDFFYRLYLLSWPVGFFLWFWIRGGQTLGMRAWRIRVIRMDGNNLTYGDAVKRLLASILSILTAGLGYFWAMVDKNNRALHDHLSGTTLIMLKKVDRKKHKK